ncbi:hypothetical protein CDL12_19732 [Handroanthus impetiginosus]|uniref:Uncharacterized protein n=1 Tax=Handroanthus impetiginosus TaxID=429701 RepID=A0A2G9GR14_9LAMI|nr:hypothetical protein CDL12_19732 [Handroanthus impetiginosus]
MYSLTWTSGIQDYEDQLVPLLSRTGNISLQTVSCEIKNCLSFSFSSVYCK